MIWRTKVLAVNLNTGEQIMGIPKEIIKEYKVVWKKYHKTNYGTMWINKGTYKQNEQYTEKEYIWGCIPKPKQIKIDFKDDKT